MSDQPECTLTEPCCEKFAKEAGALQAPAGGGWMYPLEMRPDAQFEFDGESWNINGCCGGGCYVVTDMRFCPFCGTQLSKDPHMRRIEAAEAQSDTLEAQLAEALSAPQAQEHDATHRVMAAVFADCDRIQAALRQEAATSEPQWQPIETAPKDGTWFWVKRDPPRPKSINVSAFRWDASYNGWFAGTGWWPQVEKMFTHWMPLPSPTSHG